MGSGKTCVGKLLAERLGWRFVDLDTQIEARSGSTVAEIFRLHGEREFRRRETEALKKLLEALQDGDPTVIALGGGAFTVPENKDLLDRPGLQSVFLEASFDEVCRRIGDGDPNRPLFADLKRCRELFDERQQDYLRATFRVRTAGRTPSEVAREIELLLGKFGSPEES